MSSVTLTGTLQRIIFQKGDFIIAQMINEAGLTIFKGTMSVDDQEKFSAWGAPELTIIGKWVTHPKYGKQLQLIGYYEYHPASEKSINASSLARFLVAKVAGMGMVGATDLITNAGGVDEVVRMIEKDPVQLTRDKRIDEKLARRISSDWLLQRDKMEVISFFADLGITTTMVSRFWDAYGPSAVEVVKDNPYILISDIDGIGFKRADEIAAKLGIDKYSSFRIQAGIIHSMSEMCWKEGNCYVKKVELLTKARKLLDLHRHYVSKELDILEESGEELIVEDNTRVYLPMFKRVEESSVDRVLEMLDGA